MIINPLILIIMRKVMYCCQKSGHRCRSLSSLRSHVEFFNSLYHHHNFDGEIVNRYVCCRGIWLIDTQFSPRQINVVNGRALLRRINAPLCSFAPCESNVKP